MAKVWCSVVLLATMMISSMSAPAFEDSYTTDLAVEQVKEAAKIDLNFVENDLLELQQRYATSMESSLQNFIKNLALAINQTYENDMPKDTAGFNSLCLEGVYDDVVLMIEDLNGAVAACANHSFSANKLDRNLAQIQNIIANTGNFSRNLTNSIDMCLILYPKISWDRLQCVFKQVDGFAKQYNLVFSQFSIYNKSMNGHLMLLVMNVAHCYQQALNELGKISKAILEDVDSCKEQLS